MVNKHPLVLLMIIALCSVSVNAIAGLRLVGFFNFNYNGTPETVSGYTELDVRLARRQAKILELSVTGQNLLHGQHLEYVISNPNPRTEIERSVYIKAACRF